MAGRTMSGRFRCRSGLAWGQSHQLSPGLTLASKNILKNGIGVMIEPLSIVFPKLAGLFKRLSKNHFEIEAYLTANKYGV